MFLFKCNNLCLGYGSTLIQENLNIQIDKGDYVFILGENGTGKSTLIKTILGFIKPYSGTIEYSPEWDRKKIGYLPQTSEIQKTFPATVKEIVLSGCQSELGLFARALCATASVIIMDEPAKGFDSVTTQKMYEIVSELNAQGVTVITISHDAQAAQKYAGKIIRLEKAEALK